MEVERFENIGSGGLDEAATIHEMPDRLDFLGAGITMKAAVTYLAMQHRISFELRYHCFGLS